MSVLLKESKFCKGEIDCEAIIIAAWSLVEIPGAISGGKAPKIFWLINAFKAIKQPTVALKDYFHGRRSYASS